MLVVGVAGYVLIEGWTVFDALYMTVITVTTVGFREVQPLSTAGQAFTMLLIVYGVGVILYVLTNGVGFVIEGQFAAAVGGRVMRRRIGRMKDHYILCGFGRVGEEIAREFVARAVPFVVVDDNAEALARAEKHGYLRVQGDAMLDATLEEAGVRRARGLIAAGDSDAGNTYITLSAKALNPALFVIVRAGSAAVEAKLRHAGADRVVSPYTLAGRRMALAATQPFMVDFVDTLVHGRHGEVLLADFKVEDGSPLAGQTLDAVLGGARTVSVLAVRRADGTLVIGPPVRTTLAVGDQLVVLGEEDDVRSLGAS